ncbi:MAG: thiamine-monophosphate kinase [Deltaproteobacteria bacterium]|nr:thiamine-monophosphate kinase [Deltaproteobacteria bacterium]
MKENEFIEKIRTQIKKSFPNLLVGIGDDAAVYKHTVGSFGLFATDMLVEGIHFESNADPELVGRKALAVNLSDIAAMGGKPTFAVIALAIPPSKGAEYGLKVMEGIRKLADEFQVCICGGDTVRSNTETSVAVSVLGEAAEQSPLLRNGAKPGDAIAVTGSLGGSLASGKHLSFTPRVKEGLLLNKHFKIHSMIDLSDGLVSDLKHILVESKCGALLFPDKIPISAAIIHHAWKDRLRMALCDGEDFELLFTLPAGEAEKLTAKQAFDCPVTIIGTVQKERGLFWQREDAELEPILWKGYEHTWDP